jgi:MFS superfamily sulfate permease-like transporter
MYGIIFIGILSAVCFGILAMIGRAMALDIWEATRIREIERQRLLAMDPLAKELQRAMVVQISTRRRQQPESAARLDRGYGRTA